MSLKSPAITTANGKRKRVLLSDLKVGPQKNGIAVRERVFPHWKCKQRKGEKERRNSVCGKMSWILLSTKDVLPIPVRKEKQHQQKKHKKKNTTTKMKQKLITVQAQTRWEIRHGLTIGFDMNASKQATIIEFIKSLITYYVWISVW